MDEIIDKICIFGEDSKPIKPLITKVEYTFAEFQKLYAPFCGDARVHVDLAVRIVAAPTNSTRAVRALALQSNIVCTAMRRPMSRWLPLLQQTRLRQTLTTSVQCSTRWM